jgi:hypothetical protein
MYRAGDVPRALLDGEDDDHKPMTDAELRAARALCDSGALTSA